jgi:hypothetical protein
MTAAFALQRSEVVHLLSMEFSGGTVRLASSPHDISWDSQTWSAVGGAMMFEGVQETPDLSGQSVVFTLDGVSQVAIAAFLAEGYIGRLARLYRAHLDTDGTIIPDPVTLFHGYMNSAWDVTETWDEERGASSSTVKTTFTSPLVKFQQKRGIRADMTSHQRKYSGDTFFSHIAAIPDGDINWGVYAMWLGDFFVPHLDT